jgi:hypothetical protein
MAHLNKLVALYGFILIFTACTSASPGAKSNEIIPDINDFDSFYRSFHQDSLFQMSHIRFPLEGEPDQSDTIAYTQTFYWRPEHWVRHRLFNPSDTAFERSFRALDSSMIIEVIRHRLSPLKMERRWSRNDTAWELIYYSPLRTPVQIEIH